MPGNTRDCGFAAFLSWRRMHDRRVGRFETTKLSWLSFVAFFVSFVMNLGDPDLSNVARPIPCRTRDRSDFRPFDLAPVRLMVDCDFLPGL